jgi:hypothetical protein
LITLFILTKFIRAAGDGSKWSPNSSSPTLGKDHDLEEDPAHHHKKSVLTKVKEKAKRLRYTLSKKKYSEDGNTTPSWGVSLEDDEEGEEEDAEYLGAPSNIITPLFNIYVPMFFLSLFFYCFY